MAQTYICLYHSYLDYIEALTDEERGRLLTAILRYGAFGEETEMAGSERLIFPAIRSQIDRDRSKYTKRCETNAKNVMNRWNGPRSDVQSDTNRTNGYETYQGEREREGKGEYSPPKSPSRGRKVFSAPTVDEVAAYCKERGNSVDAQTFVDFYASKGWLVGKTPMKDWKAAVRTWERNRSDTSQQKAVKAYDPYASLPWD